MSFGDVGMSYTIRAQIPIKSSRVAWGKINWYLTYVDACSELIRPQHSHLIINL